MRDEERGRDLAPTADLSCQPLSGSGSSFAAPEENCSQMLRLLFSAYGRIDGYRGAGFTGSMYLNPWDFWRGNIFHARNVELLSNPRNALTAKLTIYWINDDLPVIRNVGY